MSILKSILGGRKIDQRDTNRLIFDLAEHGNRPADLQELYRRLPSMELFGKVSDANFPFDDGARHVVRPGEILKLQSASIPGGHCLVQFFTNRTDPRLRPRYIGILSRDACEMVLKMDGFDGLMLCNPSDSWIALLKPELERLLRRELA